MSKEAYRYFKSNLPHTRWWWFSGEIKEEDILFQLDWLKENNFGGVEIAWVYPLPLSRKGPKLLDDEWSRLIVYTKEQADQRGLQCDFTLGTLWPFGGSFIPEMFRSKTYKGYSNQRLKHSWEMAYNENPGFILDHLSKEAVIWYVRHFGSALKSALNVSTSGLFCDSFEVETKGLWCDGFEEKFKEKFGYNILPHMAEIENLPDILYDYRKLISDLLLENFYLPFTKECNSLGGFSRVQCHGAPTDLLAAYGFSDVPESEALLFDPEFSAIAASAAALTNKQLVTCEAFTCMYGWKPRPGPAPWQKEENLADIKLLADALFANGVNHIIWHGMPFNPENGTNQFYATVHVGPDHHHGKKLGQFNRYMATISEAMKAGECFGDIAVYLPLEDMWMKNRLPIDLCQPGATYYWEMRYVNLPKILKGHHPLWISNFYLKNAKVINGKLVCGNKIFSHLYIDVEWIDYFALIHLVKFAKNGLKIIVKNDFKEPGKDKNSDFNEEKKSLLEYAVQDLPPPLISGENLPDFWCRKFDGGCFIFLAHPLSQGLHYPAKYGFAYSKEIVFRKITICFEGKTYPHEIHFKPYQSILLKVTEKEIVELDIAFDPGVPKLAD